MEKYLPDIYQKSVYTIDYKKLAVRGLKCLLFDLDNTVVDPRAKVPTAELKKLFETLKKEGFHVILFSNSGARRLKPFGEQLDVECSSSSRKPFKKRFLEYLAHYQYDVSEVAILGDQFMTDILGGNKVGITTVLVDPLVKHDEFFTRFNRQVEKIVISKLKNKGIFSKGRYYYD